MLKREKGGTKKKKKIQKEKNEKEEGVEGGWGVGGKGGGKEGRRLLKMRLVCGGFHQGVWLFIRPFMVQADLLRRGDV